MASFVSVSTYKALLKRGTHCKVRVTYIDESQTNMATNQYGELLANTEEGIVIACGLHRPTFSWFKPGGNKIVSIQLLEDSADLDLLQRVYLANPESVAYRQPWSNEAA